MNAFDLNYSIVAMAVCLGLLHRTGFLIVSPCLPSAWLCQYRVSPCGWCVRYFTWKPKSLSSPFCINTFARHCIPQVSIKGKHVVVGEFDLLFALPSLGLVLLIVFLQWSPLSSSSDIPPTRPTSLPKRFWPQSERTWKTSRSSPWWVGEQKKNKKMTIILFVAESKFYIRSVLVWMSLSCWAVK